MSWVHLLLGTGGSKDNAVTDKIAAADVATDKVATDDAGTDEAVEEAEEVETTSVE